MTIDGDGDKDQLIDLHLLVVKVTGKNCIRKLKNSYPLKNKSRICRNSLFLIDR
jgi:hypothetical protein